jgi:hypothetical protein
LSSEYSISGRAPPFQLLFARARDRVDDAAHGAAELGHVAGRLDLHLLHELGPQRDRRVADLGVGGVEAVDDVTVLETGRAVDGDAPRLVVVDGARGEGHDIGELAAPGEEVDLPLADAGRRLALAEVDRRGVRVDGDLVGEPLLHLEVHRHRLAEDHADVRGGVDVALERRTDPVAPRGHAREPVLALVVADGRHRAHGTDCLDNRPGDGRAELVGDHASNRARCLLRRGYDGNENQRDGGGRHHRDLQN